MTGSNANVLCLLHDVETTDWNVSSGFKCEEHENPADYFLDIVINNEQEQKANEKSTFHW